ncbi:ATP-binding protein [Myxococcus sp. AM010]|uniref:ATP-binding protein n=1 Tax=Myxococcus sp. AM010 TaxID=2745138 RepID=UPI001595DD6C|nr:ATP-binding protein [Myxococcus sp. AM010]NVJ14207.1 ATP-binding protein [Myxococcus sp. AM010]
MTYQLSKAALLSALRLPNTQTIALHGGWGTGKTHLWKEIIPTLEQEGNTPLYISCMNHNSIEALKSATFGALLMGQSTAGKVAANIASAAFQAVRERLPENFQITTTLSEIQPLIHLLHSKLPSKPIIAFDDIERIPDTITSKELIGFILSLTSLPDTRIVLIANKAKLSILPHWSELREKAIGIEVALLTDTRESIAIGLGTLPPTQHAIFADCIEKLNLTNIRTIQKIRRTYDAIASTGILSNDIWELTIPSIVLFVGIDQGTINNPITIDQALTPIELTAADPEKLSKEDQQARGLLRSYNFGRPDEFELQVLLPYIRTGHLNRQALSNYTKIAHNRQRRRNLDEQLSEAYRLIHWSTALPLDALRRILNNANSNMDVLDISTASSFLHLTDDSGLGEMTPTLAESWIKQNQDELLLIARKNQYELRFHIGDLHPLLLEAVNNARAEAFPIPPFGTALEMLFANRESHHGHFQALSESSTSRIQEYIQKCSEQERQSLFHIFKTTLIHFNTDHPLYDVKSRFMDVFQKIIHSDPDSPLTKIIMRELGPSGIHLTTSKDSQQT